MTPAAGAPSAPDVINQSSSTSAVQSQSSEAAPPHPGAGLKVEPLVEVKRENQAEGQVDEDGTSEVACLSNTTGTAALNVQPPTGCGGNSFWIKFSLC